MSDGEGGFNVIVGGSARSKMNPGGNIDFLFDVHISEDGEVSLELAAVGQFPSFEVFSYPADGKEPSLVWSREETGNPFTSLFGLYDIVEIPEGR